MANIKSYYTEFDISGQQIELHHLKLTNEGAKETLLLFPGFGDVASMYLPLLQSITTVNVLIVDYLGFGRSMRVDQNNLHLLSLQYSIDIIIKWLEAAEINSVHLCGYSIGSALAILVALQKPTIFKSVILTTPVSFSTKLNQQIKMATTPLGRWFLKQAISPRWSQYRHVQNQYFKTMVHNLFNVTDDDREAYATTFNSSQHYLAYITVLRNYVNRKGIKPELVDLMKQSLMTLSKTGLEVQVIWADYDKVVSHENLDFLRKHYNFPLHSLPSGHGIFFELPKENACLLETIINRLNLEQ